MNDTINKRKILYIESESAIFTQDFKSRGRVSCITTTKQQHTHRVSHRNFLPLGNVRNYTINDK